MLSDLFTDLFVLFLFFPEASDLFINILLFQVNSRIGLHSSKRNPVGILISIFLNEMLLF